MNRENERNDDSALDIAADVALATECTGLIPALPENAFEADSQAALGRVHRAGTRRSKPVAK